MSICLTMSVFAQSNKGKIEYDPMLNQVLAPDEIATLEKYAPFKLLDVNFDLTHWAYIDSQLPANCLVLNDICSYVFPTKTCNEEEMLSTKKFNRFNYSVPQEKDRYTAFPIGNSGFFVIVLPADEFVQQKDAYMKEMGY